MDKNDYLYRAFNKQYRVITDENSCKRERRTLRKSNLELDKFIVTKYSTTIDEDWIKAIEEGLIFIEKAIAEDRQFIRTEGETVPIEKAKKVSKDSVVHLARHANMITHVPDNPNDPVIPDALYIVEKQSDYAVYENKFLYMLLIQLQTFVSMRYAKIVKLRMTYICDLEIHKGINSKTRNLDTHSSIHEESYDNPYPLSNPETDALIKRIEDIEQYILMLLNTTLMSEVSKVAMIKPPIVKTNVLKMNNNFIKALALYDFICTYTKDGYTAEEVVKSFVPLSDEIADELSEIPMLLSFISFKFGNDILKILETNYQAEEERRKEEEAKKLQDKLRRLKKHIQETGEGMEEYMLMLEARNKELEDAHDQLIIAKNEILSLNKRINQLNLDIEELNRRIDTLNGIIEARDIEIQRLNQKYIDDMNLVNIKHSEEIIQLKEEHLADIERINQEHEESINQLNLEFEEEKTRLNQEFDERMEDFKTEYNQKINETMESYQKEIQELYETIEAKKEEMSQLELINKEKLDEKNNSIKELNVKIDDLINNYKSEIASINEINSENESELNSRISKLETALKLREAELRGIKAKYNEGENIDYTTKEGFLMLESEFDAFNKFFKNEWKKTKKRIRKELLWTKEEKTKNKKDPKFKEERNESDLENNDSNDLNNN